MKVKIKTIVKEKIEKIKELLNKLLKFLKLKNIKISFFDKKW